jgi:sugar phosphate isomerase/epimerase
VTICIEPEPGLVIQHSDEYLTFMSRISSPAMAMNFDVGHLFCVGEDPAHAASRLGSAIRHIQIEDIGADRVHRHLAIGEGVIDFATLRAALAAIPYTGYVTVELYPYLDNPSDAAILSRDRLLALGYGA